MINKTVAIKTWKTSRYTAIEKLKELSDGLDRIHRNVNIAKVTGTSVGVAGATAAIIGLLTAPITFGLSLGLTIGGTVAGIAGAGTSVGSNLTELLLAKRLCKEAEVLLRDDLKETENLKTELLVDDENSKEKWYKVPGKFTGSSLQKGASIGNILVNANKAQKAGVKNASGILLNTSPLLGILSAGASVIFIALDVVELIDTKNDLMNGSKSKYAEKLNEVIKELEKNTKDIENELDVNRIDEEENELDVNRMDEEENVQEEKFADFIENSNKNENYEKSI